eukprot:843420_1
MSALCWLLVYMLHILHTLGQYGKICNPMDYGAVGDGKADDTKAIQKAMDECYLNNNGKGGLVTLPSSKSFLSFVLHATSVSNIGFEIQSSSTLIVSNNRSAWFAKFANESHASFLQFTTCSNIKIFGGGLINGQGQVWWQHYDTDSFHPRTIQMDDCNDVLMTNITVIDPPGHCMQIGANNTEMSYITILAPPDTGIPDDQQSHGTDGVDVHGQPFWIHDCYFSTGDDNVAVHANDTLLENCFFGTGDGACIELGNGEWKKNITFNNIQFNGTTNGIRIKTDATSEAGKLWDVYCTNLKMNYVDTSIIITFKNTTFNETSYLLIDGVYIENVTSINSQHA